MDTNFLLDKLALEFQLFDISWCFGCPHSGLDGRVGSMLVDLFHEAKCDWPKAPRGTIDVTFTYSSPLYVIETE
jgi:hypothetical protein